MEELILKDFDQVKKDRKFEIKIEILDLDIFFYYDKSIIFEIKYSGG